MIFIVGAELKYQPASIWIIKCCSVTFLAKTCVGRGLDISFKVSIENVDSGLSLDDRKMIERR